MKDLLIKRFFYAVLNEISKSFKYNVPFKLFPEDFTNHLHNPDKLSSVWSNHLKSKNLLPGEEHSAYSLRHSFQDRLLAVNTPYRVQADLMGHKFNRERYGNGSSLEQKLDWLEKIQLKRK